MNTQSPWVDYCFSHSLCLLVSSLEGMTDGMLQEYIHFNSWRKQKTSDDDDGRQETSPLSELSRLILAIHASFRLLFCLTTTFTTTFLLAFIAWDLMVLWNAILISWRGIVTLPRVLIGCVIAVSLLNHDCDSGGVSLIQFFFFFSLSLFPVIWFWSVLTGSVDAETGRCPNLDSFCFLLDHDVITMKIALSRHSLFVESTSWKGIKWKCMRRRDRHILRTWECPLLSIQLIHHRFLYQECLWRERSVNVCLSPFFSSPCILFFSEDALFFSKRNPLLSQHASVSFVQQTHFASTVFILVLCHSWRRRRPLFLQYKIYNDSLQILLLLQTETKRDMTHL